MKGKSHPTNDVTINPSGNESIHDVIAQTDLGRRRFLKTGLGAATLAAFGGVSMAGLIRTVYAAPIPASVGFGGIGFESIPPSIAAFPNPDSDQVRVPAGYNVQLLVSWGDPIMPGAPAWAEDATQDAAAQVMQFGMHNDGMHYFPFPMLGAAGKSSERGVLCVNNEYTHEAILHGPDGLTGGAGITIQKARKSQAAHGVSLLEVKKTGGNWGVVKTSPWGRRITANTTMRVSGPAAGHALLKSKKFNIAPTASIEAGVNDGLTAYGTVNNCAHGYTPWGTYLTCEENWNGFFGWNAGEAIPADFPNRAAILKDQNRYAIIAAGFNTLWHRVDPRFNAATNPLEPFLFGWVVEIDPWDPNSTPVKRTALGRAKHEGAQLAVSADAEGTSNRVAYYMGDDERNEYIYKFVCSRPYDPNSRAANLGLLDRGTLYVAKFTNTPGQTAGSFRGVWIPLVPDTETVIDDLSNPGTKLKLRNLPTFAGVDDAQVQALICINTRQAADAVGATMMDRPEWTAVRTYDGYAYGQGYSSARPLEGYCTLTNNNRRGGGAVSGGSVVISSNSADSSTTGGSARPPVDVANPRPDNDYGHILRWREDGNYVTATGFEWDIFVLCGDTATTKTLLNYLADNLVNGVPGSGPFYEGNIVDVPAGSADFGAPDGLWFDQYGRLWIQTDQQGDATGDFANVGRNIMACADPTSKEIRRFMTSPNRCEVTGVVNTPDGKTMFVGIQHPGEDSGAANPTEFSNWPQSQFPTNSAGEAVPNTPGIRRPRASVLVITRQDGGIIGA